MQTTTNGIPALTDTSQAHLHPSPLSPRTLSILVALVLPIINLASSNCNAHTARICLCTLQAAHLEVSLNTSHTYSTVAGVGDENREGRKLERLAELEAHNSISMSPQGRGLCAVVPVTVSQSIGCLHRQYGDEHVRSRNSNQDKKNPLGSCRETPPDTAS
jgi:hypothetical protein